MRRAEGKKASGQGQERTERESRNRDPLGLAAGKLAHTLDGDLPGPDAAMLVAFARL